MLKLIKYDFRRNRDQILAVFIITILVQIGIGYTITSDQELFMMNITTYIIAALVLLFLNIRTYDQNLRYYNRQLLPVPVIYTILSPLLLFLSLLIGVFIVGYIHLGIYIIRYSDSFLPVNFWSTSTYALLPIFWSAFFAMLFIMFSITTARSVRMKGSVWIGLGTFFVIQYAISFLEHRMFNHTFISLESAFRFGVTDQADRLNGIEVSQYFLGVLPILFEAVIAIILIAVMIRLIKRRVES